MPCLAASIIRFWRPVRGLFFLMCGVLLPFIIDGREFDNSYERNCPEAFRLCDVIDGWQLALQRMRAGDKWIIYIPYTMGYGTRASGPIPAFSTLVFEVELLGVA